MCGIAGIYDASSEAEPTAVNRMIEQLSRRGPDASGVFRDGALALGHTRLAILDLSSTANQPLVDRTGQFVIVFNGEIYNYRNLRQELETRGASFATRSDTEVILEAYHAWGTACVERFNGMFALAIWDRQKQELFLARDRMGEKPLLYATRNHNHISFASDLRALMLDKHVGHRVNRASLAQYLTIGYTLEPQSMLMDVQKLPPGHWLLFRPNRGVTIQRYWDITEAFEHKRTVTNPDALDEELRSLLSDATTLRTVADVPVGVFLSGGLDSSAIAALCVSSARDKIKRAFTVSFTDRRFDESSFALRTAQLLHLKLDVVPCDPVTPDDFEMAFSSCDEPIADTSLIPMYYLAQHARRAVTVCLSGDGADEIFCGYSTYIATRLSRYVGVIPRIALAALHRAFQWGIPASHSKVGLREKLLRFLNGVDRDPLAAHAKWREVNPFQSLSSLIHRDTLPLLSEYDPLISLMQKTAPTSTLHYLDRAAVLDIKSWLTDDILVKVDRTSMAHGLEVRPPFLDHRVVEFAASLPVEQKLYGLQTKRILRRALSPLLPEAIRVQSKRGFNSPIAAWLMQRMRPLVEQMLSDRAFPLQPQIGRQMYDTHVRKQHDQSLRLFSLLSLYSWWRRFERPSF